MSLTRSSLPAHDAIVAAALDRHQRLLERMDKEELASLSKQIDWLTRKAEQALAMERDLG